MTGIAFIYPGQGSQQVGMGKAWAERSVAARRTFEEADDILGEGLTRLCWEGPEEELALTTNTQPALLTCSVAIHRALADEGLVAEAPVAVAGHSLGEYSALVAVGALEFADALGLVRQRGELMQRAVPAGEGAMAAILALDADEVASAVEEARAEMAATEKTAANGVVTLANDNAPGQVVIAGHTAAVERACELALERGARKAKRLAVSAPFHSPLMAPAREGMAPLLAATPFHDPAVPVVVNVDAVPVTAAAQLRDALIRQIDSPVRWVESVRCLERELGAELYLEIGPGTVLMGMVRRIVESGRVVSLAEPKNLEKLDKALDGPSDDGEEKNG